MQKFFRNLSVVLVLVAVVALSPRDARTYPDKSDRGDAQDLLTRYAPTKDYMRRPFGLISYDGRTRGYLWTLEVVTKESLKKRVEREGSFYVDHDVPSEFAPSPADYAGSHYDQGHGANARNHQRSASELKSTFAITNAVPQTPALNRGPWQELEEWIRVRAEVFGVERITILTAAAYLPGGTHAVTRTVSGNQVKQDLEWIPVYMIGKHRVWIPTHCVKSILVEMSDGKIELRTWCLPNDDDQPKPFSEYEISADDGEEKTGLEFWHGIPDEDAREKEVAGT